MTIFKQGASIFGAGLVVALHAAGAMAQEDRPGVTAPQLSLPYAEQKYRGDVGTTYLTSDPP